MGGHFKQKTKISVKDFVLGGIEKLRRHEVFMVSDSKNLTNEQASYAWKKDVTGHFMSEPDKRFLCHIMDACRHASTRLRGTGHRIVGFVQNPYTRRQY